MQDRVATLASDLTKLAARIDAVERNLSANNLKKALKVGRIIEDHALYAFILAVELVIMVWGFK
jgi:hypothetical protein